MDYDFGRLDSRSFEQMIQALLLRVIGPGVSTFGDGADGGREATYVGEAPFPSDSERWSGSWIFQVKYYNTNLETSQSVLRKRLLRDLRNELAKITTKYERQCDHYFIITNIILTAAPEHGSLDKISNEIHPDFSTFLHIVPWGYTQVSRYLDDAEEIRRTYALSTPGDELSSALTALRQVSHRRLPAEMDSVLQAYLRTGFSREQNASLDQAGGSHEDPIPLSSVFIQPVAEVRDESRGRRILTDPRFAAYVRPAGGRGPQTRALDFLLSAVADRSVVLGGPGQGKSTLMQFLCQVHRGELLRRPAGFRTSLPDGFEARIPFKVILKDFAQELADDSREASVENYVAHAVSSEAGGAEFDLTDLRQVLATRPSLVIFDGLDEVIDTKLRAETLSRIRDFEARFCASDSKVQVVATSRPVGYEKALDPASHVHLTLETLDEEQIIEFSTRWFSARGIEKDRALGLVGKMRECARDSNIKVLMQTPLQVTIIIMIVIGGGPPPRQREELFDNYLQVIYKRELAKSDKLITTPPAILFELHQYIGYILHLRSATFEDTSALLDSNEFEKVVEDFIGSRDRYAEPAAIHVAAGRLIKEAEQRLVLLVCMKGGHWGFELRALQEFFAASHLVDSAENSDQRYARFKAIALSSHWRNVALFFAGRVGRKMSGEAGQLVIACSEIDSTPEDKVLHRGAQLALEMALDRSFPANRDIQASAIRQCLQIVGGPMDTLVRGLDLQEQLSNLPLADQREILLPELEKLVAGSSWDTKREYLRLYAALDGNQTIIEKSLAAELRHSRISRSEFLSQAIGLGLRPKFISQRLGADSLDEDCQQVVLGWGSYRILEYAMPLWRELKLPVASIKPLLSIGPRRLSWESLSQLRRQLAIEDSYSSTFRALALMAYVGAAGPGNRAPSDATRLPLVVSPGHLSVEPPEIKTAWIVHEWAQASRNENYDELFLGAGRAQRLLSPSDLSQLERLLFVHDLPSIDGFAHYPRMSERTSRPSVTTDVNHLTEAVILSALASEMSTRLILENHSGADPIEWLSLHTAARTRRRFILRDPAVLSSAFVLQTLEVAVGLLDNERERWRAVATIRRLFGAKWEVGSWSSSELANHERLLAKLLRHSAEPDMASLAVSAYSSSISRCSVKRELDGLTKRLLESLGELVQRAPALDLFDSSPSLVAGSLAGLRECFRLAADSPLAFVGALSWTAILSTRTSGSSSRREATLPRGLYADLIGAIARESGLARTGAICAMRWLGGLKPSNLSTILTAIPEGASGEFGLTWAVDRLITARFTSPTQQCRKALEDAIQEHDNRLPALAWTLATAYWMVISQMTNPILDTGSLGLPD